MGHILYACSSSYMYVANDHLHFGTTENSERSYDELLLSLGISPVRPYRATRCYKYKWNVSHDTHTHIHTHMQKLLHVCMDCSVTILIAITTVTLVEWWNYSYNTM